MTDTTAKDNKRWSNKMEAEDSLRTLDCLRGRLLAERQASRVAKEEAELMGNKLIELENKLREETKLRQKADKKLKFLSKKLESLKISPTLEGSEQSSSSEICGFSCSSSSTSTSRTKDHEELASKENVLDSIASALNLSLPIQESSRTQHTSEFNPDLNLKDSPLHKSAPSCQDSKACSHSYLNSEALVAEKERNGRSESDNGEYVDNSLALVPVSLAAPTTTITKSSEFKIANENIREVLDALRQARESIKSSMERRNMIRVGPT